MSSKILFFLYPFKGPVQNQPASASRNEGNLLRWGIDGYTVVIATPCKWAWQSLASWDPHGRAAPSLRMTVRVLLGIFSQPLEQIPR